MHYVNQFETLLAVYIQTYEPQDSRNDFYAYIYVLCLDYK